jgi:hypothetical protein
MVVALPRVMLFGLNEHEAESGGGGGLDMVTCGQTAVTDCGIGAESESLTETV